MEFTNKSLRENLKYYFQSIIDKVYIILTDTNKELKEKKYDVLMFNHGINNYELLFFPAELKDEYFEIGIHHTIYKKAFFENYTNILILEENNYFIEDKIKLNNILKKLDLEIKKLDFQNIFYDIIYLNNNYIFSGGKLLNETIYQETHGSYIINLKHLDKFFNNEQNINCYNLNPKIIYNSNYKKNIKNNSPFWNAISLTISSIKN